MTDKMTAEQLEHIRAWAASGNEWRWLDDVPDWLLPLSDDLCLVRNLRELGKCRGAEYKLNHAGLTIASQAERMRELEAENGLAWERLNQTEAENAKLREALVRMTDYAIGGWEVGDGVPLGLRKLCKKTKELLG